MPRPRRRTTYGMGLCATAGEGGGSVDMITRRSVNHNGPPRRGKSPFRKRPIIQAKSFMSVIFQLKISQIVEE